MNEPSIASLGLSATKARTHSVHMTCSAIWYTVSAPIHPKFGPVTLRQLFATWTAHDLSHIGQIARVMAKQYRDAVGPWREYLPIMDR